MSDVQRKLDALLKEFDEMVEPFSETSLYSALCKLQREISDSGDSEKDSCAALEFESMAFCFCPNASDEGSGRETYYGPTFVGSNGNEYPSIRQITSETIEYWKERSKQVQNPILRCRYADLVWDSTKQVVKGNPDVNFARTVIDTVLTIINKEFYEHPLVAIVKIERALSLSLSIKDPCRIQNVTSVMIDLENRISKDDRQCGLWGFSFRNLVENKKVQLAPDQREKIIGDIEKRLERVSIGENFYPYVAECAAMLLAGYYNKIHKTEDVKRVLGLYGQAVLNASEHESGIVGSNRIQKLFKIFHDNGMKDEANALTERIRDLGKMASEEMQCFSATIDIPEEKKEQVVSEIVHGSLEDSLARFAVNFIPNRNDMRNQICDLAKEAPLQYLMSCTIVDEEGRAIGKRGSLEEDLEGHIIAQTVTNLQFGRPFLRMIIERISLDEKFTVDSISEYLFRSPIFDQRYRGLIETGVSAYLARDHVVAAHILVPQIEHVLRELMKRTGGPVYKPARNGGYSLCLLDDILRDKGVVRSLGESVVLYLRVLLTDQGGWNLRNNICHGLQDPDSFGPAMGDRLFHVLLLLALVREKREDNPEGCGETSKGPEGAALE